MIVERKLRRRQLTDDGNVEITGRDLREKTPPVGQGSLFETGGARVFFEVRIEHLWIVDRVRRMPRQDAGRFIVCACYSPGQTKKKMARPRKRLRNAPHRLCNPEIEKASLMSHGLSDTAETAAACPKSDTPPARNAVCGQIVLNSSSTIYELAYQGVTMMRKLILGTASVLALGIGGAALDFAADADDVPNAVGNMPSAPETSHNWQHAAKLSKDDIRWAQVKLLMMGLYKGSLDGIAGQETKEALLRFQKSNGIERTAKLDQATADALIGNTDFGEGSSMPPKGEGAGSMINSSGTSDFGRHAGQ